MLSGKGFYIWVAERCEGGDPDAIAREAERAGFTHALIKIADGIYSYNVDPKTKIDLAQVTINALKARGIIVWGWHYVYGGYPEDEAARGIQRTVNLGLDGYVINAEVEYKNKHAQALRYMKTLRGGMPGNVVLALSAYRFPKYHPEFPWEEFLSRVSLNMPQVYWMEAHNPGAQLRECIRDFSSSKYPQVPIFPTGAAFRERGWQPTFADVVEFMDTVVDLGLPGCNFWEWGNTREYAPELWEAIAAYNLNTGTAPEIPDIPVPTPEPEPEPVPIEIIGLAKTTTRLNVRAEPRAPGALRWFTMEPNTIVHVIEIKKEPDGSFWLRIGEKQWAAMKWREPATGKMHTYMEWVQ